MSQLPTALPTIINPNTQQAASFPKEDKRSAKTIAKFIYDQYNSACTRRRMHAIEWMMVKSFLKGIHYFEIDGMGGWKPIPPKPGEIRSIAPIMKPQYRTELGRLNSNTLGVTCIPNTGGVEAVYQAMMAQDMLTWWLYETNAKEFWDTANQILLVEGMVGYYRYIDSINQQVRLKPIPGSELFPIPFDARNPEEMVGLIHSTIVSKAWLEDQDDSYVRAFGKEPPKKMTLASGKMNLNMSLAYPNFFGGGTGSSLEGATALTVWMKPTPKSPNGEYIFMLGEEMYRYDPSETALHNRKLPVKIVYYDKQPDDWWGHSFCGNLIPIQRAANRALTAYERSAQYNRPYLTYNKSAIDPKDLQPETSGLVGYDDGAYEDNSQILNLIPPVSQGPEIANIMSLMQQWSDVAAGYRSPIVFGDAPDRASASALQQMQISAQAPLIPVLERMYEGLAQTYPEVLSLLKQVWPEQKRIRVVGKMNIGKEILINQMSIPSPEDLTIRPTPLLPNGKDALLSMLFQLRQIPGQDGVQGSEVKTREFRRAMRELDYMIPGLEHADKEEERIQTRINMLINDGQQPAIAPADPANLQSIYAMENHRLMIEMLKDKMLEPAFYTYSAQVQQALGMELEFHMALGSAQANVIDDDVEKFDADQMESFLAAAEADMETTEGEVTQGGIPLV